MKERDDAELVHQALSGSGKAFSELVRRYTRPVYGIALSFVRDFDVAEDMAQEAFLAAYEQLATLDQPARFGNWLRIITANRCRTYLRMRRSAVDQWSERLEAEIQGHDRPEHVLSPEQRQELREDRSRRRALEASTMEALGTLTLANRQALTLYYLGEQSMDQVAQFLGVSRAAAKMRLHRARRQLQEEELKIVSKAINLKIFNWLSS